MTGVSIVEIGAAYAMRAAAIEAAAFGPRSWGQQAVVETLEGSANNGLLASIENDDAGILLWQAAADEASILTLGVTPGWRRRGIAASLVAAFCATAKKKGCAMAYLDVAADNVGAIALYAAADFCEVVRRAAYYRNGGDALIMRRSL